ncbi:hypothetical protein CK203_110699 [Vitis vinifera]|uniref:DUF4218 domain-containing protein n=1 Tax=Vitis vinifera TaxID=29760 RepID=A0A438DH70_VITVI|nr:hypothetical protein CK203_110699 [Vitis vinifera]
MDRSWMSKDRRSKDYADGVESFIAFALQYSIYKNSMKCPCLQCGNMIFHTPQKIREHLFFYGTDQSYHTWYWHGDAAPSGPPTSRAEWHHTVEFNDVDSTIEMVQVAYDDQLLSILGDMLPLNNELPLSMWKLDGTGTKKRKGVPAKVMWYFPPIPRFRRLFQSPKIAKDLIWHAQEREFDGKMRHPSDSPSWKLVDYRWPDFASEPRNLRLVISADGPRQPGNDIDVYLAPLLDDLKMLWDVGVECYDVHQQKVFTLRVVLLWTINDFPAYGNLSGCVVKGYFACPVCGEDTFSHKLKHRKKNSYTGHRRFLPCNHPFRKQKKAFNGKQEFSSPPQPLSREEILRKIGVISNSWGKNKNSRGKLNVNTTNCWKRSPYSLILSIGNTYMFVIAWIKVVDVSALDKLQNDLVVTLCLLEKYFPPSFFDIMLHLTVHLVREVRLCGPVYLRWMYPFERFMKVLKGYVRNRNRPEGCIAECYITEEAIEFCTEYLSNVDAIRIPISANIDQKLGHQYLEVKL